MTMLHSLIARVLTVLLNKKCFNLSQTPKIQKIMLFLFGCVLFVSMATRDMTASFFLSLNLINLILFL